ncbi:MAG TPA: ABC transporter permease [Vicinamibacterales bacterium]|nr:ABC transporter permease [Vicinamibacterales bacterium]
MSIYRWLVRIAAPSLAREYGSAMEEMLAAKLSRAHSRAARAALLIREIAGLPALAWSDRQRQLALRQSKAGSMDTLFQEVQQAARRLWRTPSFTLATVLTLGLAIGANAAIFAVVERVVINPLPYPDSDRLIEIDHGSVTLRIPSNMATTPGLYLLYKNRSQSVDSAAIYQGGDRTLLGQGEPERILVFHTTPSLATVLRVQPALGRWFTEGEGRPADAGVAVLSHGLWTRRFGRNPAILGESIQLDGRQYEVVGVMPQDFAFPLPRVEAWVPVHVDHAMGFGLFGWQGIARLRDGITLDTARAELQGLIAGIAEAYPDDPRAVGNVSTKITFTGRPLKDVVLGNITRALWLLLAAVGVVLAVACANVANLFLVRTELRQREVAIRKALGASRSGLGRFFFTESTLLAITGGILGTAIAWIALQLLVQSGPANLPRVHEIRLHPITIAYIATMTLIIAAVFGAIPLWRGTAMTALRESGRGNTGTRQNNLARQLLLGGQIAMAVVLLVASGLMVRSFLNLRAIDPGFNPESTLTFSVGLPSERYGGPDAAVRAHHAIIDRLAALPGVRAASATTCLPLSMGCNGNTVLVEGRIYPPGTLPPIANFRAIAGGYFETMGMRILRGRSIDRGDVDRREPVVVISQAMARHAFGDEDPIGRRIASNQPPQTLDGGRTLEWLTVVGIVADTPMMSLTEPAPRPMLFMPLSLGRPPGVPIEARLVPGISTVSYVVRTTTSPESLVPAVRDAVKVLDSNLPVAQVRTLQDLVDRAAAQMTFTMVLLAIAATISLFLGVIGIYGVTSYIVSQRTAEIGVRLALGAEPASITRQIVTQGGVVSCIGIAIGLAGAFAGGQLIASVLYGVSPRDPVVFVTMAIVLQLVALIACWVPARRAAALNPTIALRTD